MIPNHLYSLTYIYRKRIYIELNCIYFTLLTREFREINQILIE